VTSLARYSAGFGVASTHNGCVFGLRGEMVDAVQLPPLIQVPLAANGGIRSCVIPTVAQVTAHYSSPSLVDSWHPQQVLHRPIPPAPLCTKSLGALLP
jgi:hypothetical protein